MRRIVLTMRSRLKLCLSSVQTEGVSASSAVPLHASKAGMATHTEKTAQTPFETRQLGNSNLHLSPIGFGAWAIGGGDWEFGWGEQEDEQSVQTILRALEVGINWIDTAAVYGLGHSEVIVGRALQQTDKKPYIFTKCSMRWNLENRTIYRSLKDGSVQEEIENSLQRLNLDAIDLYQIHWPNPEDELEEGWTAMARLQEQGLVRYIGVSNFSVEQMKRAQAIAPITSLQPPYSLMNTKVEQEILPYCLENNIGVINYSPMASGLLTGKMSAERVAKMPADDWRKKSPNFNEPRLSKNLKLAELLGEIGKAHGVEPGVVAIAWTLHHAAVTAAIVGARRPDQVDGIIAAAKFRLSEDEFTRIEQFRQQE
jgi:aryl-alcohol dehydrogenase-like predicted oxidoreductase